MKPHCQAIDRCRIGAKHLADGNASSRHQLPAMPSARSLACLLAMVALSFFSDPTEAQTGQRQWKEPATRARDVLPQELLSGPGYVIDDAVEVKENRYLFTVKTEYGGFTALGIPMLKLRLREHYAIKNLHQTERQPLALESALHTVKDVPAGAWTSLTDPIGSIRSIPKGITQTALDAFDPLEKRAGTAARRRLAFAMNADPETRNPVLRKMLRYASIRETVGEVVAGVGVQMAVPALGLTSGVEKMRMKVASTGPRKLAEEMYAELIGLRVHKKLSREFVEGENFTTLEKLVFVSRLQTLQGVAGLDGLVSAAVNVSSEARLLSQLRQLLLLAAIHEQRPIAQIYSRQIPVARLEDSRFIGVVSVDILNRSDTLAQNVDAFRRGVPEADVYLLVDGKATPAAKETLAKSEIRTIEIDSFAVADQKPSEIRK